MACWQVWSVGRIETAVYLCIFNDTVSSSDSIASIDGIFNETRG